jgi:uncharacterized protein
VLTGPLIRARVRGDRIEPQFIDPQKPSLRQFATDVHHCIEEAALRKASRAELEDMLDGLYGNDRQQKLLNGITKVALDRCDFNTETALDPVALRREVFLLARERGPVALEAGLFNRPVARDIYHELQAKLGHKVDVLEKTLYGDLRSAQQLERHRIPSAEWLLHRYNVALVQALLLRSLSLSIQLKSPTQPRLKQLFRYIKFHQLIHRATLLSDGIQVVLDGPTSLLRQSTRYGMALANFFPALLLQPTPWTLEATVLWTKARHRKRLSLAFEQGLHSHYPDTGAYESRTQQWFRERFEALKGDWKLSASAEPITLGPVDVFMPDFTFSSNGRTAHLEIIGYWSSERLAAHLKAIEELGPANIVVAVSRKLNGSKEVLEAHPGVTVIDYAEVIPAKRVLAAIEEVATPSP